MENIDFVALNILRLWLSRHYCIPADNWDISDPNCRRQSGPHVIWSLSGRLTIPVNDIDMESMWADLVEYLRQQNSSAGTVFHFNPYNLELYQCSCGCGSAYIIVSVYN